MSGITLERFIQGHRDELISRCRVKVSKRAPPSTPAGNDEAHGVPRFLDQVVKELRDGVSTADEITNTATKHGRDLLLRGFTVGQVVHGYGDVCQSITELAGELGSPISAEDFGTLNRCLDDAIAGAVTEHARDVDAPSAEGSPELLSLIDTALLAFEALQRGNVAIGGATGQVLQRTLASIRVLALSGPRSRSH